jgi:hypothetical protein
MKNWLKVFILAAIVGALAVIYAWFFLYNKPHKDYEAAKPDYFVLAEECYNHFAQRLESEEKSFTGKVIQINGVPSEVENLDTTSVVVFTFNTGMFGDEGIRCTMLPDYHGKAQLLKIDTEVSIKGYCTGYNDTDVILEHCSIIEN